MRRVILLLVALAALGIAGCGGDDNDSTSSTPASTPAATTTEAEAPADTATTDTETTQDPSLAQKPVVKVPKGPAPKLLQVDDIVEGTGDAAKAGDTLTVDYVGVLYKNGKQFDASWDNGKPFQFQLGAGNVIQGWDQGLVGMKVGGRRELIIPPNLGYGAEGSPPVIPPNAPLVFVVDLKAIN
jgi:peptidylprolyl isomerase